MPIPTAPNRHRAFLGSIFALIIVAAAPAGCSDSETSLETEIAGGTTYALDGQHFSYAYQVNPDTVYELRICDPGVTEPHTTRHFPDEAPSTIGKYRVSVVKTAFSREQKTAGVVVSVHITISVEPGAEPSEVTDDSQACGL